MTTKPVKDVEPRDVVQICMTGTTFQGVVRFLESHRLTVDPFPFSADDDEDAIPTYMVGISQELWNEVKP